MLNILCLAIAVAIPSLAVSHQESLGSPSVAQNTSHLLFFLSRFKISNLKTLALLLQQAQLVIGESELSRESLNSAIDLLRKYESLCKILELEYPTIYKFYRIYLDAAQNNTDILIVSDKLLSTQDNFIKELNEHIKESPNHEGLYLDYIVKINNVFNAFRNVLDQTRLFISYMKDKDDISIFHEGFQPYYEEFTQNYIELVKEFYEVSVL